MHIAAVQAALNARGLKPPLACDGIAGRKTMAAIDAALAGDKGAAENWRDWSDVRRMIAFEQIVLRDAGIEVGVIDGLVGEQMRYAREARAARLRGDASVETWRDKEAPDPVHVSAASLTWPKQAQVTATFGSAGTNQATLELPFPMRLAWDPSVNVFRTSCNAKVKDPLRRIWTRVLDHYGYARLKDLRLDMFGGCLAVRKMRGGSSYSMHSWGIAWDVDPDRNQLKWGRELASLSRPEYEPFWKFVEAEGFVSLGRARNYDFMHFQAARL